MKPGIVSGAIVPSLLGGAWTSPAVCPLLAFTGAKVEETPASGKVEIVLGGKDGRVLAYGAPKMGRGINEGASKQGMSGSR